MFEAMACFREGSSTFSFKVRKGFYRTKEAAIEAAKKKAKEEKAIPYVLFNGKCVWSPLTERLGN